MGQRRRTASTLSFETKLLRDLKPILYYVILGLVGLAWMFKTFAPTEYVDKQNSMVMKAIDDKHKDAIDHSDLNTQRMMSVLSDVKDSVKTIENRTWQESPRRTK